VDSSPDPRPTCHKWSNTLTTPDTKSQEIADLPPTHDMRRPGLQRTHDLRGPSVSSVLMTYEPLALRSTYDLSSLGMSTQTDHGARNTTSHAENEATDARGRRGTEMVIMAAGPMPPTPSVIMSTSREDQTTRRVRTSGLDVVRHRILPRYKGSFIEKPPTIDPHLRP
jgi:hypothetical protein